jgi:hypothetical protein
MPSYRVMLDVPRELILFVSALLAARRLSIGTRKKTRKLGCYRQALFGLAWFRDKADVRRLGTGFGLSQATAYRYLAEVIDVLAEQAPGLREALERAVAEGTPYVILDGKVVDADRCREKTLSRKGREIDLWYSGKKKGLRRECPGSFLPRRTPDVDLRRPAGQRERPVRGAGNGPLRDRRVHRRDAVPCRQRVRRRGPRHPHPGENAQEGEGTGHQQPDQERAPPLTALHRGRGFALLSQRWQTLQLVTMSPGRIGEIARAALVLTLFEHKMIS